jgi:hypothetical protein
VNGDKQPTERETLRSHAPWQQGPLHRASRVAQRLLPRSVWSWLRRWLNGLIAPIVFSWKSGHFRSSIAGRALDRRGNPVPWYTYPAIALLLGKNFEGRAVLEFGGGGSTLWWAGRADRVVCLEEDETWCNWLRRTLPSNTTVCHVPRDLQHLPPGLSARPFDIIVVDGCRRDLAMDIAVDVLHPSGVIILDNSDGFWGAESTREQPIHAKLRDQGFMRADFYGSTPGLVPGSCTSMYFRAGCFLFEGAEDVRADGGL